MSRKLRQALAAIDGIDESDSAFKGDIGYWVNGKESAPDGTIAASPPSGAGLARRRRLH